MMPGPRSVVAPVAVAWPGARIEATAAIAPPHSVETQACPDCDDANPCNVDDCDTASGACLHVPLDCSDGNACTADGWNPAARGAGCVHISLPGPLR